ncbi:hypothetical protein ACQ86O_02510 [Serratia sp. L9]|uniref:hypothetical protein n=1 Tax=Serratia sp. L9 TaxID=3423946 RepID=UPI003D672ED8
MIHFIKMITFLILAGFSLIAQANCTISNAMAVNPVGPLTYKGQADGAVIGSQIGSGWGGSVTQPTVFGNCGGATKQNAYVKPRDIPTGVIYSNAGINYPIYPTGVNGIGYVIGIKDPYASAYISISPPQVQTFPTAGVSNDPRSSIGYTAQVLYVITGTLKTGTYVVPSKIIADLTITNAITGAMFASPTTLTLGGDY